MMIIRKEIDLDAPLTESQKQMLKKMQERPAQPDEDCPELTDEQIINMIRKDKNRGKEK